MNRQQPFFDRHWVYLVRFGKNSKRKQFVGYFDHIEESGVFRISPELLRDCSTLPKGASLSHFTAAVIRRYKRFGRVTFTRARCWNVQDGVMTMKTAQAIINQADNPHVDTKAVELVPTSVGKEPISVDVMVDGAFIGRITKVDDGLYHLDDLLLKAGFTHSTFIGVDYWDEVWQIIDKRYNPEEQK